MSLRGYIIFSAAVVLMCLAFAKVGECANGCVPSPCFRNGTACMGQCSCQYYNDIAGVCG